MEFTDQELDFLIEILDTYEAYKKNESSQEQIKFLEAVGASKEIVSVLLGHVNESAIDLPSVKIKLARIKLKFYEELEKRMSEKSNMSVDDKGQISKQKE